MLRKEHIKSYNDHKIHAQTLFAFQVQSFSQLESIPLERKQCRNVSTPFNVLITCYYDETLMKGLGSREGEGGGTT